VESLVLLLIWVEFMQVHILKELPPISFECIKAECIPFNVTKFSLNLYAFDYKAILKEKFATDLFISFHLQTYFWSTHTFYECFLCARLVCRFAKKYARNSLALMSWNPKPVWKGQWGFCTSGADPHSVGNGTVPECSVYMSVRGRLITRFWAQLKGRLRVSLWAQSPAYSGLVFDVN
jgi:hypothetical protein